MVSLKSDFGPWEAALVLILILSVVGGVVYFQRGTFVPAYSQFATVSVSEITVNDEQQLVINALGSHGLGDSYVLRVTPSLVEQQTDGEYTIEETIEIKASGGRQWAEYELQNQVSSIYDVNSERATGSSPWSLRDSKVEETFNERYSSLLLASPIYWTHVLDLDGWFGDKYRQAYALVRTGSIWTTKNPTVSFEQEIEVSKGTEVLDRTTISSTHPVSQLTTGDQELLSEGTKFGEIAVLGQILSLSDMGLRDINFIMLNNDGDRVLHELWRTPDQNRLNYIDCMDKAVGWWASEVPSMDYFEGCEAEHIEDFKRTITPGANFQKNQSRVYYELQGEAVQPLFQIRLNPELIDLKTVHRPLPDPSIEEWEISADVLMSGEKYVGTYEVCNYGEGDGAFWRFLSGDHVAAERRGQTAVVPQGECIEETIDVEVIAFEEVNTIVTLTLSPYTYWGDATDDSASVEVKVMPVADCRDGDIYASSTRNEVMLCVDGAWTTHIECRHDETAMIIDGEPACVDKDDPTPKPDPPIPPIDDPIDKELIAILLMASGGIMITAGGIKYAKR